MPWISKNIIENIGEHEVDSIFYENIASIDELQLVLN